MIKKAVARVRQGPLAGGTPSRCNAVPRGIPLTRMKLMSGELCNQDFFVKRRQATRESYSERLVIRAE